MPEATPEKGALTVRDAADQWPGLIGGDAEEAKPEESEQPESEERQPEEEERQPEAQEQESEQPEEQDEEARPTYAETINLDAEKDRRITIMVDGKPVTLALSEAAKGFQFEHDYRRKTSDVAEQRKAVEADRAAWANERQQHIEALRTLHAEFEKDVLGEPPDIALLDQNSPKFDANTYHLLKAQYDRRRDTYGARLAGLQQAHEERLQATRAERQKQAQEARTKLIERIPDFADAKKAQAISTEVRGGLAQFYGFSDKEIRLIADPRMVEVALDAIRGRKAREAAEQKKVVGKPKPYVRPGVTLPQDAKTSKGAAALAQLRKDHSVNAGAAFFRTLRK